MFAGRLYFLDKGLPRSAKLYCERVIDSLSASRRFRPMIASVARRHERVDMLTYCEVVHEFVSFEGAGVVFPLLERRRVSARFQEWSARVLLVVAKTVGSLGR